MGVISLSPLLILLTQLTSAVELDLTVEVKAGGTECFWQRIKRGASVELEYQVQ